MQQDDKTGDLPTSLPDSALGKLGAVIGAAVLFALMMFTVADVVGRNLFDTPLRGGYELSGLILMALFFIALPFATAGDRHITVELIGHAIGRRGVVLLQQQYRLAGAVILALLCVYAARHGLTSQRYGETTMVLRLPVAPMIFFASASLGVTALILAGKFLLGLVPAWRGGRLG